MNYALTRIEAIRGKKGISRYQLAKDAKIPYTTLSNMYKKDTMPTLPTLQKICEGLDMTMAQFFTEGENKGPELTANQKRMLVLWDRLPREQQARAMGYLEGLNEK